MNPLNSVVALVDAKISRFAKLRGLFWGCFVFELQNLSLIFNSFVARERAADGGGLILDAMENVANPEKYPEFKGNVAAVYTHPLEHTPGSSGAHYGKDAETYMNVGQAMGQAMVGLLKGDTVPGPRCSSVGVPGGWCQKLRLGGCLLCMASYRQFRNV